MSEPTNADILKAIVGLKNHIDGRFDEMNTILEEMRDSEQKRNLGLAERVERIERHLGLVPS